MKKVIYIIAMALCLLSSCNMKKTEDKESEVKRETLRLKGETRLLINHFEYDGHKYIMFFNVVGSVTGYVHDPDCPCHEQYINKGNTSDYPDW